jgi:hypothetical protein
MSVHPVSANANSKMSPAIRPNAAAPETLTGRCKNGFLNVGAALVLKDYGLSLPGGCPPGRDFNTGFHGA